MRQQVPRAPLRRARHFRLKRAPQTARTSVQTQPPGAGASRRRAPRQPSADRGAPYASVPPDPCASAPKKTTLTMMMAAAKTLRVDEKILAIKTLCRRPASGRNLRYGTLKRETLWRRNRNRHFKSVKRKGPANKSRKTKSSDAWSQKRGALTACRASKAEIRISPACARSRKRCHHRGIRLHPLTERPGGPRVHALYL